MADSSAGRRGHPRAALYVRVDGVSYGPGEADRLRGDLQEASRATEITRVSGWRDLALDPLYALPGGYRFTQAGLGQVCSLLAPGLFRLLLDVSGALRAPGDPVTDFSLPEAASIYNMLLARRFESKVGERIRLVRNTGRRTVDGVVGARYVMLSNAAFVGHVERLLREASREAVFYEGSLVGRRLAVRFVDRKGLARGPDRSVWHSGSWFCNSEIGGESPVCGSALLCNPASRGYALGPLVGGKRVIHVGRDFERRVGSLFQAVDADRIDAARLAAAFARLAARAVDLPADRDGRERVVAGLADRLARRNIPKQVARRAIVGAMHEGGLDDEAPIMPRPSGGRAFSYFDLYRSLADMGKSRHSALRERIERAAFGLLQLEQP